MAGISAGGAPVRWKTCAAQDVDVTFVSHFDGRVRGTKTVSGKKVIRKDDTPFIMWTFDGVSGQADMVDGKWVAQLWDDEIHFRRFPHTVSWFFRHFGV